MKKIMFLLSFALLIFLVAAFFLGMSWSVSIVGDQHVYERHDVAMEKNKVIATVHPGQVLKVEKCFFDKSDAYFKVAMPSGGYGFIFDNSQRFTRSWSFHVLMKAVEEGGFGYSYDCQRLSGQFGVK